MHVWLVVFALAYNTGLSHGACATHKLQAGQTSGVLIKSPNYPDLYSNDEDVCWRFSVTHGRIQFVLPDASTEPCCDGLTIHNGTSKFDPLLANIKGKIGSPGVLVTSGSRMYVRFTSSQSNTFKGFQACVCAATDKHYCRCDDKTFDYRMMEHMTGSHDDHRYIHVDYRFIRTMKLPVGAIIGIAVGIIVFIFIVIGVPVQVCGCKCTQTTQHPSAYSARRRQVQWTTERVPISVTGHAPEITKDGNLLANLSPARPWILPLGPNTPPAYTAFSLPPSYQSADTGLSPTEMIISPIGLRPGLLPPIGTQAAAATKTETESTAQAQVTADSQVAAVPQTTVLIQTTTPAQAAATADTTAVHQAAAKY